MPEAWCSPSMFWVMTAAAVPRRTSCGDRAMAAVGLRGAKGLLHREAAPPGLAARLLRGEEIGEVDRRHLGPDAAGAAEVGDARFGADAGAGKDDGAARFVDHAGEFGDVGVIGHGVIVANAPRRAKFLRRAIAGVNRPARSKRHS